MSPFAPSEQRRTGLAGLGLSAVVLYHGYLDQGVGPKAIAQPCFDVPCKVSCHLPILQRRRASFDESAGLVADERELLGGRVST